MSETSQVIHAEHNTVLSQSPTPPLDPQPAPSGDGQILVVQEGYKVQELKGRRSNRRQHVFDDLESFAAYLNRHAKERERAEILVGDHEVVAALDPANIAGDVVRCSLTLDPSILAWQAALGKSLDQKKLHALVRAQRDDIDERARDEILGALRSLEVVRNGEFRLDLDETGYARLSGTTGKAHVAGNIPPTFEISIPVYEGVEVDGDDAIYDLEVMLSIEVVEDGPRVVVLFQLAAPSLPAVLRKARREAAAHLQEKLEDGLLVGLGRFQTQEGPSFSG